MKKRILVFTICFALTTASALASGPMRTKAQQDPPVQSVPCVKSGEQSQPITREEAKKRFEEKRTKEKECLYNSLGLTPEQRTKAEALDVKTKQEVIPLLRKIQVEARALRDLKAKHASIFAVYKQKLALEKAKNDTKKCFENSRKSFDALLTKEQKEKYKLYQDEKKKEREKFKKHKYCVPKNVKPSTNTK